MLQRQQTGVPGIAIIRAVADQIYRTRTAHLRAFNGSARRKPAVPSFQRKPNAHTQRSFAEEERGEPSRTDRHDANLQGVAGGGQKQEKPLHALRAAAAVPERIGMHPRQNHLSGYRYHVHGRHRTAVRHRYFRLRIRRSPRLYGEILGSTGITAIRAFCF